MNTTASAVPAGVRVRELTTHVDARGGFTEIFRDEWDIGVAPVQWNVVRSEAGVLRGVHCHPQHADALVLVAGWMRLGLCDLRTDAPPRGSACVLDLRGEAMQLVMIPPGVAHGFLFPEASMHVYAVDRTWDPADEMGCRWDDPELSLDWQHEQQPRISARDAQLGTVSRLRASLSARGL